MKNIVSLFILMLLSVIVFNTCDKEEISPDDKVNIDISTEWEGTGDQIIFRGPGNGNGNGNGNGDGDDVLYKVEYHGDLTGVAIGPATKDNKKTQLIQAGECSTPIIISGLPGLVGCFESPLENIWGPSVRLIDKRLSDEEKRVSVWLFITYAGDNHWVKLFGSMRSNGICDINVVPAGGTILPEANECVWVKMDRIVVETVLDGCTSMDEELCDLGKEVNIKITQALSNDDCSTLSPVCP